eukprot:TRINITY_DN8402_c0_g2_i1.p1 TRINITY_DN8402_c0_g2~~TRINITY_DN8402_c0_g2_i1.p1  ORF type:complete len:1106 (+),score=146.24 TRINITY_DN8402_c0_g2_i1:405-3320(+)
MATGAPSAFIAGTATTASSAETVETTAFGAEKRSSAVANSDDGHVDRTRSAFQVFDDPSRPFGVDWVNPLMTIASSEQLDDQSIVSNEDVMVWRDELAKAQKLQDDRFAAWEKASNFDRNISYHGSKEYAYDLQKQMSEDINRAEEIVGRTSQEASYNSIEMPPNASAAAIVAAARVPSSNELWQDMSYPGVITPWSREFKAMPSESVNREYEIRDETVCEDTPGWTNGYDKCIAQGFSEADGCVAGGITCIGYLNKLGGHEWCVDGQVNPKQSWGTGDANNNPERNCCACGGGTNRQVQTRVTVEHSKPTVPPLVSIPDFPFFDPVEVQSEADNTNPGGEGSVCKDTPGWVNGFTHCSHSMTEADGCTDGGLTCFAYSNGIKGKKICADGAVVKGSEWATGTGYNEPETNCCACGGGTFVEVPASAEAVGEDDLAGAAAAVGDVTGGDDTGGGADVADSDEASQVNVCTDTRDWTNGFSDCSKSGLKEADGCTSSGLTCKGYELGVKGQPMCVDGAPKPEFKWAMGEGYNRPDLNCCVCGGGSHSTAPAPVPPATPTKDTAATTDETSGDSDADACVDTKGWSNGFERCSETGLTAADGCIPTGLTCKAYELGVKGKPMCAEGAPNPDFKWAMGEGYNRPDQNCCVCGGGSRPRAVARTVWVSGQMKAPLIRPKVVAGTARDSCTNSPNWVNGFKVCRSRGLMQADGCEPGGLTCRYYEQAVGMCVDGSVGKGFAWAMGKKYNYPERNCCVCGGGSYAATPAGAIAVVSGARRMAQPSSPAGANRSEEPPCTNTPGWVNGFKACGSHGLRKADGCAVGGLTCRYYEQAKGMCVDGAVSSGFAWAMGEQYNFPERNCCVCGGHSKSPLLAMAQARVPVVRRGTPSKSTTKAGTRHLSCANTPGWVNGFKACGQRGMTQMDGCEAGGLSCRYYEQAVGMCVEGGVAKGFAWAMGKQYNFPEKNCCVCGGGSF